MTATVRVESSLAPGAGSGSAPANSVFALVGGAR